MTETVSGSAVRKGRRKSQGGLKVRRIHTTPGVHPYDQVTWERRDVVMTNWRDGSVNFEQHGVEFPDSWSVNAANIVTTKYFRGAVGTPQREWSLKQLVDRVTDVYTATGRQQGYFASDEDAEIFDHELKYALIHQIFAFNSPVWFNVGTASPQQVSACQPYGALVSTPAGLVPIGKLVEDDAVGAKVYDAHGLTRIVATKANGVKPVLRVHTKAGDALDVTADHLVWRSSGEGRAALSLPGVSSQATRCSGTVATATVKRKSAVTRSLRRRSRAGCSRTGSWDSTTGTNRSLTIEAMTVTDAELDWVTDALDQVFPGVHRHERTVETQDTRLDCRRTRLYGEFLREFTDRWDLQKRGTEMEVPARLFTAPLPVVAAYLRSVFQAEGFVSARQASTVVEVDMISEQLIRGMQQLLLRFGVYARVGFKADARQNRHDCWTLRIQSAGDRRLFADAIGFIDPVKAEKLERSFDKPGLAARETKRLQIDRIEQLGDMEVYDIQTESGEYLSGNLRVHNCFILAVDDTMDSILDWYREEGLIFKGGSGAGVNLSRIRSSKELLSSGGTASGPVSFMRGADASAGTIKSGGATRRAAKMVVLDVDHPDVAEFIETKAREEDKIRVLRDAGFDMDLGGQDIVSVQYQNANNSVRVSDEFMQAVEDDMPFDLLARRTGEIIETIDAKDLFRKLAQAAWECADPGIQYDGMINDWHTCPESGRITASNPCSEYVHLDNSSCNLASINLLKFLRAGRHVRRGALREDVRTHHHGDGHLHLLRGLPDREDRRDHPRLPPARHRLRQPRRAADGHRSRLRFRGRPRDRRRDHEPDDRRRLQALRGACQGRRPLRRLRAERHGAQAGHAHARRRQRQDPLGRQAGPRDPRAGDRGLAGVPRARRGQRLPERPGQPARAHRHHRPHDGLRHHRHRARPRAGQVQEAGRRRVHADRQPDRPPRPEEPRLPARTDRSHHRVHRRARPRGERPRSQARALRGVRLRDGRALDQPDGPRPDDGRRAADAVRLDLQDGQHARVGHRRGGRGDLLRGLEARPEGARDLPRQLQGRPAAVHREEEGGARRGAGPGARPVPGTRPGAGAT